MQKKSRPSRKTKNVKRKPRSNEPFCLLLYAKRKSRAQKTNKLIYSTRSREYSYKRKDTNNCNADIHIRCRFIMSSGLRGELCFFILYYLCVNVGQALGVVFPMMSCFSILYHIRSREIFIVFKQPANSPSQHLCFFKSV